MTFVFFLPDLISSSQLWIGTAIVWLAEARHAGGETFGLSLLLALSVAVPVALWWAVYRTVLVWLRERPQSGSRPR